MYINAIDRGYVRLAEAILECQSLSYDIALKKWARNRKRENFDKVNQIEKELMSYYYDALTLFKFDAEAFIRHKRKEYDLPERKSKERNKQ